MARSSLNWTLIHHWRQACPQVLLRKRITIIYIRLVCNALYEIKNIYYTLKQVCLHRIIHPLCGQAQYDLSQIVNSLWPSDTIWRQIWDNIGSGNGFVPDCTKFHSNFPGTNEINQHCGSWWPFCTRPSTATILWPLVIVWFTYATGTTAKHFHLHYISLTELYIKSSYCMTCVIITSWCKFFCHKQINIFHGLQCLNYH